MNKSPDRTLWIIIGVIAALVLIALVVVFTRGAPRQLDASRPAGIVQRYSEAAIAGDESAAGHYLTEDALARCSGMESFVRRHPWLRADQGPPVTPGAGHDPGPDSARPDIARPDSARPDIARLAGALAGVAANRVLVVTGPCDRVEVIPLQD